MLAEATEERLLLDVDYDPTKVNAMMAQALIYGMRRILQEVAEEPQQQIHAVPLANLPTPPATQPAPDIIVDIEARLVTAPDRAAVVDPDGQCYDYAALCLASNRVAYWATGLPADAGPVGLVVRRSFAMVAALVGLLRAGRTVALLDPDDPVAIVAAVRAGGLSRVLADEGISVLGVQVVRVAPLLSSAAISGGQPALRPPATAPAVVVFTSATSGHPKPVMLTRAGLSHHAAWVRRRFRLTEIDRVLQFCSVAFDALLEELLPPLAAGATVVLRDESSAASGAAFGAFCADRAITIADLPTGFFNLAMSELAAADWKLPASLRLVIIGGEAYAPEAVAAWRRLSEMSPTKPLLCTTYGPAEATVVVAAANLTEVDGLPLVGEARPGCALYVLDRYMQHCPVGVIGELYVAGAALSAGYLAAPAATAEMFLPDPFASEPGTRMYRTGDMVVCGPDGFLRYFGRADRQVKLRGVRIQLLGVESILSDTFGVPCAVVVAGANDGGDGRLIAFIQAEAEADPKGYLERARAVLSPAVRPAAVQLGSTTTHASRQDRPSCAHIAGGQHWQLTGCQSCELLRASPRRRGPRNRTQ